MGSCLTRPSARADAQTARARHFGEHPHGGGELEDTYGLQTQYGRVEAQVDRSIAQGDLMAIALRQPAFDGAATFVKGQLLPGVTVLHGVALEQRSPPKRPQRAKK
jgi:hypothetical protein